MINIEESWQKVRETNPLVHTISNLVSANDCANLLLAVGASPMMASAPQEMEDITALSKVTVLNLGTPDDNKFKAVARAGIKANELNHPVIIDPVGVGASTYRHDNIQYLLAQVKPTIIRANVGEIQSLLGEDSQSRGVDSFDHHSSTGRQAAISLAQKLDCVVLMTGIEDFITDGMSHYIIKGGSPRLKQITGTGDMLSVLCGALTHVTDPLTAAIHASYTWKLIGEFALKEPNGLGQAHIALFDYAGQIDQLNTNKHTVSIHPGGTINDH